jgi:serine/threonine protein kinase/Tfp pilus assembly protein PilF
MIGGTQTRWRRIETLFHQALSVKTEDRDAFLVRACSTDEDLRAELDSLLSAGDLTLSGFSGSVSEAADALLDDQQAEMSRIGAYRILRTLGQGGMGTVYLGARDDDQYNRIVAIKVLRAGLAHRPELQLLFRGERQILADFDHPNIARMLDGGITAAGSPYLVMEYIDGVALDTWCREQKVSLDGRLRLFRQLVSAVAYAHRHLVIHRDIKPLNVLVTAGDTLKLLDFGIAKLADPMNARLATSSAGDEQLLTPDYASPEQLAGQPITTATDVYALGLLLHELLTGELPHSGSRDDPRTHLHRPAEHETRPSEVCRRANYLQKRDAARLRGDLDAIVLKCLRHDSEQRYATAAQLGEDLDRYFKRLPVEAAEPALRYRVRKFVLRHQLGVAITALSLLAVAGFVIAMAILARKAHLGEAKARREEQFLASIFRAATPEGSKGESVTARQLLDKAAARLKAELGSDPDLEADMTESVANSYVDIGLYDRAQPLLERALDLTSQKHGDRNATYAAYLENLGTDVRLQGKYKQAEPIFRRSAELHKQLNGDRSAEYAHSLSDLGEVLYLQDKDADAEKILREALAIERPMGNAVQDGTRSYLALTIERRGAYPEAAQLLRDLTQMAAARGGKESQDYLVAMHNLAGAQIDAGDLEGAARTEREVLTTRRRIWGPDHPDTAYSLNNLGWIYLELGQWQEAEPLLKENVTVVARETAQGGARYAVALANWGRLLEQKGDYTGAAAQFDEAQRILAANGAASGWAGAKVQIYQSLLALDRGRASQAEQLASQAVNAEIKLGGDSSPQLSAGLLALGLSQLIGEDASAAQENFRKALAIRQRIYPAGHPELLYAQVRLAEALLSGNKANEALRVIDDSLKGALAWPYPLPAWRMAEVEAVKGLALRDLGREREAAALLAGAAVPLSTYNQPALRHYLEAKIGNNYRRPGHVA